LTPKVIRYFQYFLSHYLYYWPNLSEVTLEKTSLKKIKGLEIIVIKSPTLYFYILPLICVFLPQSNGNLQKILIFSEGLWLFE
jgi:hypothetical protein